MAHTAELKIENKTYNIIECEYELEQPIQDNGQPAGQPGGGIIEFTLLTPTDEDPFLYAWMRSSTEKKDGQVVFSITNVGKMADKTIKFEKAYCIKLSEHFNKHDDESQMLTKITISADTITLAGKIKFE